MRRATVAVGAALAMGLAGGATLDTASRALAGTPPSNQPQLRANEAVARRDARALLAELRLPRGITRSSSRPRVGGVLVGVRDPSGHFSAGAQAFWTTENDPQAIIAYVKAHRPHGSKLTTWGSGTGPGSSSSVQVTFSWPPLGEQAYNRTLTVSVISAPGSASAIVAQSDSDWIVPRSPAERVPDGVHSIAVTLRLGTGPFGMRHMHRSQYVVRKAWRVDALVRAFNSLQIVQPGAVIACTLMLSNGPSLSLSFRDGSGATLAHATVRVSGGKDGGSGWTSCDPITFWIGAKQQTPLISRTFVKRIGKLIGAEIS